MTTGPLGERFRERELSLFRAGWGANNRLTRHFFTDRFIPGANDEEIYWFNEMQRASATPEVVESLLRAMRKVDVRDDLPRVQVPTLVIHRRRDRVMPFEAGRELAARIPGARFLVSDGESHIPLPREREAAEILAATIEFVAQPGP